MPTIWKPANLFLIFIKFCRGFGTKFRSSFVLITIYNDLIKFRHTFYVLYILAWFKNKKEKLALEVTKATKKKQ